MNNIYPYMGGIVSMLNEWGEKINAFIEEHGSDAFMGAAVVGVVFAISAWGIRALNKK